MYAGAAFLAWVLAGHSRQSPRLAVYIERDIAQINFAIDLAAFRQDFAELLIASAKDAEVARNQPEKFLASVQQAAFTYTATLNSDTFAELRSTGNLGLLQDRSLKTALFEYYRENEEQRQYKSLQGSPDFVAWLPEARALQIGLIRTHRRRLDGAEGLLALPKSSESP